LQPIIGFSSSITAKKFKKKKNLLKK